MNPEPWTEEFGIDYLARELAFFDLLKAAQYTLLLTAISMPLSILLGLVLALMRRARLRILSWPAAFYIEVIRGTPLLVQMFLVYFTLPQLGQWLNTDMLTLNSFVVGILCLAGNYAAYEAEILRAGLEAIDAGQREAALSIGMSEWQAFRTVVLPQAFRIVVPPIINDLIAMLKDSSLVSVLGVQELLNKALTIGRSNFTVPKMLVVAAAIYLVMSLVCYMLGKYAERKLHVQGAPELHLDQVHGH
ncbi:MAG TPA: amino acid ABC transporter permease [Planctomycetota bacterium]|jgi:His/Glu/Gln/Arg/opine family amino acid ABC transporter permease subunit